MKTVFAMLAVALCICSCQKESEETIEVRTMDISLPDVKADEGSRDIRFDQSAPAPIRPAVKRLHTVIDSGARMLMKDATLTWETESISQTHDYLLNSVSGFKGYVSSDRQTANDETISTFMHVYVPSDKFDEFMSGLEKGVKKFDEKNITVVDVTTEYIDADARVRTKKELEERYFQLLKQAKNVEEVLRVEEELNEVRLDIESSESRMKYLETQTTYSSLFIKFYQVTAAPLGFGGEIVKNFKEGGKSILNFLLDITRMWAYIIVAVFAFWACIRWIKKRRPAVN